MMDSQSCLGPTDIVVTEVITKLKGKKAGHLQENTSIRNKKGYGPDREKKNQTLQFT